MVSRAFGRKDLTKDELQAGKTNTTSIKCLVDSFVGSSFIIFAMGDSLSPEAAFKPRSPMKLKIPY
ncbi:MAG: hypothetical protein RM368_30980 [Nostoc sp. DedSLP03]|uniref:hypothetical protein n=1 Tax=Nostoc sp. DedSLP03 TaxID=3075400 RepID=UPI002AD1E79A|nr:hypothetical protein [Nostoc sp. DedSLP03]MDZ7969321.1 hypothetical protein [Nostoc sp. DedSLP03]